MIEIKVRKLRETLELLEPVIPRKSKMPVLNHFLLQDGRATATDLEMRVSVELPEATESILLPRGVLDFLKFVPGETMASISQQEAVVNISCGVTKTRLPTKEVEDYPPAPEELATDINVDGDRFIQTLDMALCYAATETARPILNGVSLFMEETGAKVAAGDGFRMFYKELPGRFPKAGTVVLPAPTVKVLANLWKKAPPKNSPAVDALLADLAIARRLMALGFGEDRLAVRFGNVSVTSRLIAGTPPNFLSLLPADPPQKVKVFAPDFALALRQVKDVATGGAGIVRLEWDAGTLKVSAVSNENKVETEIEVSSQGDPGRIAFNYRYLLEYFKDRQGMMEVGVSNPSSPGLFLDGRCQVVIMPMFVQWGDEPNPETPPAAEVAAEDQVEAVAEVEPAGADAAEGDPEFGAED